MATSLRLYLVVGLLVSPLIAEPNQKPQFKSNRDVQFQQNPQILQPQNSIFQPAQVAEAKPSGFKTMLFRVLGIGGPTKLGADTVPSGFQLMPPNFQQGGPCGIPLAPTTTTQSPYGPCPFPQEPYPAPLPTVPMPTLPPGINSAQVTADPFDRAPTPKTGPLFSFPQQPVPDPARVPPVPSYPVPLPARVPPVAPYPVPEPSRVPPSGPYPYPEPSRVPPVGPYPAFPPRVPNEYPTPLTPLPSVATTRRPTIPIRPEINQVYSRRLPCSALQPFVPHGFQYASIGRYASHQCDMLNPSSVSGVLRNEPPCSTLDSLQLLGANKMRELIRASGMDVVFMSLSNYTLFAPLDVAFSRLPAWLLSSLETDEKLRQAFVRNHLVKMDVPLSLIGNEYLVLNDRPGRNRIRMNVYFEDLESPIYSADGARIVRGDILVANSRIHLTDKVVMPNPSRNAAEYISEKQDFEAFWNIVKNTNLEVFQSDRPITLFIPLNSAVEKVDLAALTAEPDKLARFVAYHVVNGTYYSAGLINSEYLTTNYDREIKVGISSDSFSKYLTTINGRIRVVKSDIPLLNGVAHVVEECFSERKEFFLFDGSDEFEYEYGVISKRSMKVTGEEKFLDF